MIRTSSQQTYTDLLIKYQPKTIKTEEEYQRVLSIVEKMMSCELTKNETALFELLVLLIENYESQYYPLEKPTFQATLESLIHEFDVEKNTLVQVLGSLETVNNILDGREKICQSQAEKLAEFFNALSSELSLIDENFRDCL